jgi:hypothetical protein
MSALFNLAGLALILPNLGLALFFLAVSLVAEQKTLGALVAALWALLGRLPHADYLPFIMLALLAALVLLVIALVRIPFLLPLLIVVLGVASIVCVGHLTSFRELAVNPLGWLGVAGVMLGGWQFWRATFAAA